MTVTCVLTLLFFLLFYLTGRKKRCAIMFGRGQGCPGVFLERILEIQLCGNNCSGEISVNALWKLYLDYADVHFFSISLSLHRRWKTVCYSYVNSLRVSLESCSVLICFPLSQCDSYYCFLINTSITTAHPVNYLSRLDPCRHACCCTELPKSKFLNWDRHGGTTAAGCESACDVSHH